MGDQSENWWNVDVVAVLFVLTCEARSRGEEC